MKKLQLCFEGFKEWNKIFKESKNFARRYEAARISECEVWNKDAMNTMKMVGAHMRELELNNCEFSIGESKMIAKIFRCLGELESLKLYDVDFDVLEESELVRVKPLNLDKLKTMVLHESSFGVSVAMLQLSCSYFCVFFRCSSSSSCRSSRASKSTARSAQTWRVIC